jgi:hypothetical protein
VDNFSPKSLRPEYSLSGFFYFFLQFVSNILSGEEFSGKELSDGEFSAEEISGNC